MNFSFFQQEIAKGKTKKTVDNPPEITEKDVNKEQISFFSGNPFVEKVQGILHFYKEKYRKNR